MESESRDEWETLRKLDAEYRITYSDRQMTLLKRIMHPHLKSAGFDAEYIDKLSEWQKMIREYERISDKASDEFVKMTTMIEETSSQLQEHLRIRSKGIDIDFQKVILSIEVYVRSKK